MAARLAPYVALQDQRLGQALFEAGGVGRLSVVREYASSGVVDPASSLVHAHVRLVPGEESYGCTCDGPLEDSPCRHVWALALEVDAFRAAVAALGAKAIWFRRDGDRGEPYAWRDEASRRAALAAALALHHARHRASSESGTDHWRPLVEWLGIASRSGPRLVERSAGKPIGYAVRIDEQHGLCVRALARRRGGRDSGFWDARVGPLDAPEQALTTADARLVRLLKGMSRVSPGGWFDIHVLECSISPQLFDLVLPALVARPDSRWQDDRAAPLEGFDDLPKFLCDDGGPFRFAAELVADGDAVELRPTLVRDGESVALTAVSGAIGDRVRIGDRLCRWDVGPAAAFAQHLIGAPPLRAPATERDHLIAALATIPGAERIHGVGIAGSAATPVPCLSIEAPAGHKTKAIDVALGFRYGDARLDADDDRGLVRIEENWHRRDAEAEARARARLAEFGAAPTPRSGLGLPRIALARILEALLAEGWRIEAEKRPLHPPGTPRFSVRTGIDWFELEAELPFGSSLAKLVDVLDAIARKQRMVPLGDGGFGLLPENWLAGWEAMLGLAEREGDSVRFRPSQAMLLDAMLAASAGEQDVDAGFADKRARLRSFERIAPRREPEGFRGELRPYQRDGLAWLAFLAEIGFGGCLADDMGLGKTVQVLAHLAAVHRGGARRPSLVVAPRSLIFNWKREAARFAPALRVCDFSGTSRFVELGLASAPERDATNLARALGRFDLVVTTYGALLRDVSLLHEVAFHYVVLDEAQAIKNAQSQSAKAARLLRAEHRLALSGTPVENRLDELWSIFEFLNPGMLGRSAAFRDVATGDASTTGLRAALRPFVLRRTKEQVLAELPQKSEQVVDCEFEGPQRKFYEQLRDAVRAALLERLDDFGIERSQVHVFTALLRLRQAACHPALVDEEREKDASAKFAALLPMLEELVASGHKALIFSQFVRLLGLLRTELDARGLRYAYLDGSTTRREEVVDAFQSDPACGLFLISLKAGGHGLNLTAADYVFLLDPWWNPAVEAQAIDRAHRMGQQRKVLAYRLIVRGTIEERVMELQEQKRALVKSLFDDDGNATLRDLTREDLERLLS